MSSDVTWWVIQFGILCSLAWSGGVFAAGIMSVAIRVMDAEKAGLSVVQVHIRWPWQRDPVKAQGMVFDGNGLVALDLVDERRKEGVG